ncbi:hypothetical protein VTI74DRAFT_3114 [Chaetomium olivicolor]
MEGYASKSSARAGPSHSADSTTIPAWQPSYQLRSPNSTISLEHPKPTPATLSTSILRDLDPVGSPPRPAFDDTLIFGWLESLGETQVPSKPASRGSRSHRLGDGSEGMWWGPTGPTPSSQPSTPCP